jgi:hypothetical protein
MVFAVISLPLDDYNGQLMVIYQRVHHQQPFQLQFQPAKLILFRHFNLQDQPELQQKLLLLRRQMVGVEVKMVDQLNCIPLMNHEQVKISTLIFQLTHFIISKLLMIHSSILRAARFVKMTVIMVIIMSHHHHHHHYGLLSQ